MPPKKKKEESPSEIPQPDKIPELNPDIHPEEPVEPEEPEIFPEEDPEEPLKFPELACIAQVERRFPIVR